MTPHRSRECHFCSGWNRIVFIPEDVCTRCKEKEPAELDSKGRMVRKQEGHNYFGRPILVKEGQSMHKSDIAIRRCSTRNYIEHAAYLINMTRPEAGGKLTPDQDQTMRLILDIDDWNIFGFELLEDATRYGLVSLDTGKLAWLDIT
jgi:hypothetical protein